MLLGEVERVLGAHGVSRRGDDVVLVACSGGVDSVVLAHAAIELLGARRVVLGHVDHAVRPGSASDAAFVVETALALSVEVRAHRLEHGPASEERLRTLRYRALEVMAREVGASRVLVAHTEDDQAETVLLGLLRSARLEGLRGMPVSRGLLLRPLLGVSRREVLAYAESHHLSWREDPTNREVAYLRNRVRRELLPLLERRYRPGMARRLARLAEEAQAGLGRGPTTPPARASEGTSVRGGQPAPVAPGTIASGPEFPGTLSRICFARRLWSSDLAQALPDGRSSAVFDADALPATLVRPARLGDRVQPFGFHGHRKLREILRAAQVPREARADYPVVARPDGTIVWVPGVVRSNEAPVQPLTRHVWVFWMEERSAQLQGAPWSVTVSRADAGEAHGPMNEDRSEDVGQEEE